MKHYLNIHGIGIEVDMLHAFPRVSELIAFEFCNFLVSKLDQANVKVTISTMRPIVPVQKPFFTTNFCKAFGFKDRICIYPHGEILQIQRTDRGFATELNGVDGDELFDILRMYLLSSSGELLDLQGIHRLHCLGFQYNNQNILISASSGGGKSYLAYQGLLENPPLKIYSDETCLVDNSGLLYGMALPIAMKEPLKERSLQSMQVLRLSGERNLITLPLFSPAGPQRIHKIFVITHWGKQFKAMKAAFLIQFVFAIRVILGLGNMQMREFLIREDNMLALGKIAWSRFKRALYLISHSKIYHVQFQKNSETNLVQLTKYIDSQS